MNILRVLKSAYELYTRTDVVRHSKSVWSTVAAYILATRLLGSDNTLVTDPVFVSDGLKPTADGGDNLLDVAPGIAVWYDTGEGDAWLGNVKPVFTDTGQTVALGTNTHASGDDRIDVVAVRPVEVEGDSQLSNFKDPLTGTKYQQNSNQRVRWGFEFKVFEGTPAPGPSAPAVDAGYFPIAEVDRPNGQANVLSADVTDVRTTDVARAGLFDAVSGLAARAGGVVFGDPAGTHYKLARDSASSPTKLQLKDDSGTLQILEAIFAGQNVPAAMGKWVEESGDFEANGVGFDYSSALFHMNTQGPATGALTGQFYFEFDDETDFDENAIAHATVFGTDAIQVQAYVTDVGTAYGGAGGTAVLVEFWDDAGARSAPPSSTTINLVVWQP